MAEIGENTQVKANIAFMAKVIAIVGSAVWGYSVIWNKINTIEVQMMRIDHELRLNSEFRIKWPRGELGSLPDDAEQNMRLNLQQQRIDKLDSWVDGLRFQRSKPE